MIYSFKRDAKENISYVKLNITNKKIYMSDIDEILLYILSIVFLITISVMLVFWMVINLPLIIKSSWIRHNKGIYFYCEKVLFSQQNEQI
jgi:uncharacterized membrane protein